MKRILLLISILSLIFFVSCASKSDAVNPVAENESEIKSEIVEAPVIPHFDDWKYKGFGSEVPEWVEPAITGEMTSVARLLQFLDSSVLSVSLSYGLNLDHAEKRMEESFAGNVEIVESFWVRINKDYEELEEPYVLVQVLLNK